MKLLKSNKIFLIFGVAITLILAAIFLVVFNVQKENTYQANETKIIESLNVIKTDEQLITYVTLDQEELNEYLNERYLNHSSYIDQISILNLEGDVIATSNDALIGDSSLKNSSKDVLMNKEYVLSPDSFDDNTFKGFTGIKDNTELVGILVVSSSGDPVVSDINDSIVLYSMSFLLSIITISVLLGLLAYIKRDKFSGLSSDEISLLYAENKYIIEHLDEAVVSVDQNFNLLTMNQAFKKMFGITEYCTCEKINKYLEDRYIKQINFQEIMSNKEHITNKYVVIKNIKLLMNAFPLYQNDEIIGASAVFRSYLEVDNLLDQIKGYQEVSKALRNQKHEFQNKLHVVLGLIKIGDYQKAENYIMQNVYTTNLTSDYYSSRLKDDRILALFVGKEIQSKENNCTLLLTSDSYLSKSHYPINSDDLVLILGNLIDNSIDAYENKSMDEKRIVVDLFEDENQLKINVVDQAGGVAPHVADHMFERGVSSKGEGRGTGLSLVNEIVSVYNGEKHVSNVDDGTEIEIILEKVKI